MQICPIRISAYFWDTMLADADNIQTRVISELKLNVAVRTVCVASL